jgi:GntR family transcriptional regulator
MCWLREYIPGSGRDVSLLQIANQSLTNLFRDLIRVRASSMPELSPHRAAGDKLKLPPDEEIIELQKVFTADGEPVIFCSNILPRWVLKGTLFEKVLRQPSITEPIFDFLEHECGEDLAFYISALRLDSMGNCPIKLKDFSHTMPAFVIDEVGYNNQERPIMLSVHFYPGKQMKFELIRRRHIF